MGERAVQYLLSYKKVISGKILLFGFTLSSLAVLLTSKKKISASSRREGSYFHNVAMDISMACFGHLAVAYS